MLKWEEKNLLHQKKITAEYRLTMRDRDDERKHDRERRAPPHHPKDKDKEPHHKEKEKESHAKEPKMSKREPRVKKATKEEEGYGTELYNWNVAPTKKKTEVKLVIPDILKMVLVDDWEAVTKNGQVSIYNSHFSTI